MRAVAEGGVQVVYLLGLSQACSPAYPELSAGFEGSNEGARGRSAFAEADPELGQKEWLVRSLGHYPNNDRWLLSVMPRHPAYC